MQAKTWLQRFLTIIAGVMMNFILALIIFFVVALLSGAPDNKVYIGDVLEGSAASGAGIEVGDVVTKLKGIVSDRTLISLLPFTDDVDFEFEQREAELMSAYGQLYNELPDTASQLPNASE